MPKAKPNKKSSTKTSNIFVRAVNKFSSLHAPAKVLILAVVIGGFAGGSYSVYMSSAAGWTTVGTWKAILSDSKYVDGTVQACKKSVPKRGYTVISRYTVKTVKGTPPQVRAVTYMNGNAYYGNYVASKIGSVSTTQASNYVSGYTYVAFGAEFNTDYTSGTGTANSRQVSSLSTCP